MFCFFKVLKQKGSVTFAKIEKVRKSIKKVQIRQKRSFLWGSDYPIIKFFGLSQIAKFETAPFLNACTWKNSYESILSPRHS